MPDAPIRKAVAVAGNRCMTVGGAGCIERIGPDLKGAVGRPRRLAFLVEEGTPADLAEELRRLLASEGFKVFEVGVPRGRDAADLGAVAPVADELSGAGLTADDAMAAVGGAEALSLASYLAGQWCGGVTAAGVATTLEAAVAVPATPRALAVQGRDGLISAPPALGYLYADPGACDLVAEDEGGLMGRALMVQTAVINTKASYGALMGAMDGLAAADPRAFVDRGLEAACDRGRVASSTVAATRLSIRYGQRLADGLALLLGRRAGYARLLAEGMRFAARLGWQLADLDSTFVFDQDAILEALGLGLVACDLAPEQVLEAMKEAAERRTNRAFFLLPSAPGMVRPRPVEDDVLLEHLKGFCDSRRKLLATRAPSEADLDG